MPSDVDDEAYANSANGVKIEEQFRDTVSYSKATANNTTETLATILGEALPEKVGAIVINNVSGDSIHINPTGAATTANFEIATGQSYTLYGSKTRFDLYQIIRPAGVGNVSFMVKERV